MGVNSNGTVMMDQGVFENLGSVTWDTTAKTTGFTAVSGNGYFVNTTSGAITVTLPSSPSAGDLVGIKDYANTADTNAITIGRNGSNIDGVANDFQITTEGLSALLVYVDATKGWLVTSASTASAITNQEFTVATGGTITTCGDFKIHTFTGPGTFSVTSIGNPAGSGDKVSYVVVAGGGGAGKSCAGGGAGAGGYREGKDSPKDSYTAAPIASSTGLTISASPGSYPITVGAGGTNSGSPQACGTNGNPSTFSSITSAGGGFGASGPANGGPGGSGGGGGGFPTRTGGTGNTPPTSPAQGTNGGGGFWTGSSFGEKGGGGGGATVAGTSAGPGPGGTAPGGDGATSSIDGTPTARAGGGGGGNAGATPAASSGGAGGGGPGGCRAVVGDGTPGTTNTGGGGGGAAGSPGGGSASAGTGGSGIVIIRYKFQ